MSAGSGAKRLPAIHGGRASLNAQSTVTPKTLHVVTREDLVAHYAEYDGREIVVVVILYSGEGTIMNLPVPTPPDQAEQMWVTLDVSLVRDPDRSRVDMPGFWRNKAARR